MVLPPNISLKLNLKKNINQQRQLQREQQQKQRQQQQQQRQQQQQQQHYNLFLPPLPIKKKKMTKNNPVHTAWAHQDDNENLELEDESAANQSFGSSTGLPGKCCFNKFGYPTYDATARYRSPKIAIFEKASRTDGRTYGPTDLRTDLRTDKPSYRDAVASKKWVYVSFNMCAFLNVKMTKPVTLLFLSY